MDNSDWLYLIVDAAKRQIALDGESKAVASSYDEALALLKKLSLLRDDKLMVTCYVKLHDIALTEFA